MFYLPPAQESFKLYGSCNKECLQAAAKNENDYNMTIFAASSHGHMYMQKQKLSKITNGQEVQVRVTSSSNLQKNYFLKLFQN